MTDVHHIMATALVIVCLGGGLSTCARAQDSQPREGQGEQDGRGDAAGDRGGCFDGCTGGHRMDRVPSGVTRLWVARSLIAEAGWTATQTEYVALAWVLKKRSRASGRTLYETVKAYCAGMGEAVTARQAWLHELPADGVTRPEHWPDAASWEKHAPRWRRVLMLADAWMGGLHPDPCPRAIHFGGTMDKPRGRMRAVCARLPTASRLFEVSRE